MVGPDQLDDAGVIKLGDGRALVQTVDFFPPIVDDPYDFGRIAAANSLSDIYAMGATPFSVLNIVGFPRGKLDPSVLGDILRGGADKVAEAGAALLGGHSVEDAEIKFGLAVTGLVEEAKLLTNGGSKADDVLVLTKPLGMGALSTAINVSKASEEEIKQATEIMATLNASAARAMQEVGRHSVTDVTGFGLMGHATEMAQAADVTLEFDASKLPFADGALHYAGKKIVSGGVARNRSYLGERAEIESGVDPLIANLVFDAETSGGLLIAVDPSKADALIEALRKEQTPCAAIVGRVLPRKGNVRVRVKD